MSRAEGAADPLREAHLHAAHAARGDLPRVPPERLQRGSRAGLARAPLRVQSSAFIARR